MRKGRDLDAFFPVLAGDVGALLSRAEAARGVASRRYAVALLERGLSWADPGTVDDRQRARATALGANPDVVASTERTAPLHAVRIPLVDVGSGRALVRTFFASFDAAPSATPRLESETEHALAEAFDLARKEAQDPRVRAIRWVAAQPRALEAITVAGESLGAGALVSAYALLTGRAVRAGIVVTGTLVGARLGAVGHIELKIAAARAAGASALVVPGAEPRRFQGAGRLTLAHVRSVSELLEATLDASREERDPRVLVGRAHEQARRGWRGFRWPEARELLERAALGVPEGELDTRVDLLARLGAAERHAGSLSRSEALLQQACSIADSEEGRSAVPDEPRSRAHQQLAMTELRLAKLPAARAHAARGLKNAVRARSRRERIKALGVAGLVARGRGREREAIAFFEEALALDLLQSPGDVARSRAYLLESLAREGELAAARREFDAALAEARGKRSRSDEAWVRTSYGGGLVHAGHLGRARTVLDVPVIADAITRDPLPGLQARRYLGLALLSAPEPHARARGAALLLSSLEAHGPALEPSLARVAALGVLVGHHALSPLGPPDERVLRALRSFEEGPLGVQAKAVAKARAGRHREALARFIARVSQVT